MTGDGGGGDSNHTLEGEGTPCTLIRQHVNEAGGEDSPALGVALDHPLHPLVVFGDLADDDDDFPFAERQLVLLVGATVVQSPAPTPQFRGDTVIVALLVSLRI